MSSTSRTMLVAGIATVAFATALAQLAGAQSPNVQPQGVVADLGNNEGIFVDAKSFKINKGLAKGDATAAIGKLNAREISPGAILFRAGEKLYLVEGRPPTTAGSAAKDIDEAHASMMKNFQDQWAVGYMR